MIRRFTRWAIETTADAIGSAVVYSVIAVTVVFAVRWAITGPTPPQKCTPFNIYAMEKL